MEAEMKYKIPKMPKGLDLEFTHHPLTMRRVVNLIVAIERFKGSRCIDSENLLNFMLESLVEEHIVFERSSAPPPQYVRTDEQLYSVTDSKKRSLILVENSMELHAVMLQGGAENRKVHLNMSNYVHPAPVTEARTVALGIKDTRYYLSCQKDGDNPTLHLEAVDKENLSSISSDSDMVRFLFYKQDTGLNLSTLVSVAFPDWYISTAEDNNKPVEMCLEASQRHRTFNIQRQS